MFKHYSTVSYYLKNCIRHTLTARLDKKLFQFRNTEEQKIFDFQIVMNKQTLFSKYSETKIKHFINEMYFFFKFIKKFAISYLQMISWKYFSYTDYKYTKIV